MQSSFMIMSWFMQPPLFTFSEKCKCQLSWWRHSYCSSCPASARAACPRQTGLSWCSGPGTSPSPPLSWLGCKRSWTQSLDTVPALWCGALPCPAGIQGKRRTCISNRYNEDNIQLKTCILQNRFWIWFIWRWNITSSLTTTSCVLKYGCPVFFIFASITRQLYKYPSLYGLPSPQGRCCKEDVGCSLDVSIWVKSNSIKYSIEYKEY